MHVVYHWIPKPIFARQNMALRVVFLYPSISVSGPSRIATDFSVILTLWGSAHDVNFLITAVSIVQCKTKMKWILLDYVFKYNRRMFRQCMHASVQVDYPRDYLYSVTLRRMGSELNVIMTLSIPKSVWRCSLISRHYFSIDGQL